MKRIGLSLFCFFCGFSVLSSQSWTSSSVLTSTEDVSEIISANAEDGSIVMLGFFEGSLESNQGLQIDSYGGRDYFIAKFNEFGEIDWLNQVGSMNSDFVFGGVSIHSDGSIYVTGSFMGYLKYSPVDSIQSTGLFDPFLLKYDTDGNVSWCRILGSGSFVGLEITTAMQIDKSDNLIISGFFSDSISFNGSNTLFNSNGIQDYFYGKFDPSNGDPIWVKQIVGISNTGRIFGISAGSDHYLFSGMFADSILIEIDTLVSLNNSFDIHLLKTDLDGNVDWIRTIKGDQDEYCYSITSSPENDIYLGGYYSSSSVLIDSTELESVSLEGNNGDTDLFIVKYLNDGTFDWARITGSIGADKILDVEYFKNEIHVSGSFTDTLNWGGIVLTTNGISDQDMFTGSFSSDGSFRSSNSFAGRNNSTEESRAIFHNREKLYSVIRTDSDLLILGDSVYTSSNGKFYIAVGVIGCLPISVDNVIVSDVETCYGDSTGALQILATGGFGSPWQYSIDNGLSYQSDIAYFPDLPAGDYPVVVIDKENCAQPGPTVSVIQPDTLMIELVSSSDITNDADGSIVVAASGGTSPYTYTLQPTGTDQGFGTYTFSAGDEGKYIVELNDGQNCGPVAIDTIEIRNTVGVDYSSILDVKIYPNPTSGMITLEMPYEGSECMLEVLSLTGQVVMSRQVYSTGGVLRETIDVSDLSKGMYMLRVAGQTLRSSIVVN